MPPGCGSDLPKPGSRAWPSMQYSSTLPAVAVSGWPWASCHLSAEDTAVWMRGNAGRLGQRSRGTRPGKPPLPVAVLSLLAMVLLAIYARETSCSEMPPPSSAAMLLTMMLLVTVSVNNGHGSGQAAESSQIRSGSLMLVTSRPLKALTRMPPPLPDPVMLPWIRLPSMNTLPAPVPPARSPPHVDAAAVTGPQQNGAEEVLVEGDLVVLDHAFVAAADVGDAAAVKAREVALDDVVSDHVSFGVFTQGQYRRRPGSRW